ncbi:hypothetical protein [Emergencia sp. 1XD21-10]|uniref:hypothetical protein n=1 Tax=Emergencia sp. 1XD21-10 TaxID=2304569 RepID=UPI00137AED74|nr:hypothetical protein [Emergencia sp. 1XD21-10]NCE98103.1 hypothetical protein [Emergencia sp. 1XD21-10]
MKKDRTNENGVFNLNSIREVTESIIKQLEEIGSKDGEISDDFARVVIWQKGHLWNAKYFCLDMDHTIFPKDSAWLEDITYDDPAAIIMNASCFCNLGKNPDELITKVHHRYVNAIDTIDDFIREYSGIFPSEIIEKNYRDDEWFAPLSSMAV